MFRTTLPALIARTEKLRWSWVASLALVLILALVPMPAAARSRTHVDRTAHHRSTYRRSAHRARHRAARRHTRRRYRSARRSRHHARMRRARYHHRRRRRYHRRLRGQRAITSSRALEIQQALIRQHYLAPGQDSGQWDQATRDALIRYQGDNHWQTKIVPDSRALIKLGLGPSRQNLLNPETAAIAMPRFSFPRGAGAAGAASPTQAVSN